MPLLLNTAHPLYSSLIALICVDDDGTIKDLCGTQTCTPDAAVTTGTGTYGRHFTTTIASGNAKGLALSPGIVTKPTTAPTVGSAFIVANAITTRANRGTVFNNAANNIAVGPATYTGDAAGIAAGNGYPTCLGTTDIIGTGAHSFGCTLTSTASATFVDGTTENTAGSLGNASDGGPATYIGGCPSGGYGGLAGDYVWIAYFRHELTTQEITDLHASLGAANAFALVLAGSAVAPGGTGTGTGSGTGGDPSAGGSANAPGGTATGAGSGTGGAASTTQTATITTEPLENNTGAGLLASTAVVWEWHQDGAIGTPPTSVTYGTGTTDAAAVLTVTGLPAGPGQLWAATPDQSCVFMQPGTAA